MATLVCASLAVRSAEEALQQAQEAARAGADMVEFRIDALFHGPGDDAGARAARHCCARSPIPCIVTCRRSDEGGHYAADEGARLALYRDLIRSDHPPAYIDLECAAWNPDAPACRALLRDLQDLSARRDRHTRLICSMHDFTGRPRDLHRRLALARSIPAAVLKVAYRCRSVRDNLDLFDLLAHRDRPTIALGMGEFGLLSRVCAPKFGGFLTFASLRSGLATAPGQVALDDLLQRYRFRSIRGDTRVYGVIGWPVAHSRSPLVHNAGFAHLGHNGVYLPLPIAADPDDPDASYAAFKATVLELLAAPGLHFSGASVTMPHKRNLARLAAQCAWPGGAARAGACNTLVVRAHTDGPTVEDTDGPAAVDCVRAFIPDLRSVPIAVLGTGGAARSIAWALARAGAEVHLFSRSRYTAQRLADDLSPLHDPPLTIHAHARDDLARLPCRLYINCTPLGMASGPAPDEPACPVDRIAGLDPSAVFFDTVYDPPITPMLRLAADLGYRTIDGVSMFVRQAARQAALWTGTAEPIDAIAARFDALVRRHDDTTDSG